MRERVVVILALFELTWPSVKTRESYDSDLSETAEVIVEYIQNDLISFVCMCNR